MTSCYLVSFTYAVFQKRIIHEHFKKLKSLFRFHFMFPNSWQCFSMVNPEDDLIVLLFLLIP